MEFMNNGFGLDEVIDQLEEIIHLNFSTEEKYMIQYKYPHTQIHMEQHTNFFKIFYAFKMGYKSSGITPDLKDKINTLAKDWFKLHVEKVDKMLGGYLNNKIYKTAKTIL